MSGNKSKKLRRELRNQYKDMFEVFASKNANIIKQKPKHFPYPVWRFLIGFFIKVK
ncbi:MAG TPA: hypothetical protein VMV95_01950 [Bacillota bacterium]|nr:hypothetical protein [Bacillota bacterium]